MTHIHSGIVKPNRSSVIASAYKPEKVPTTAVVITYSMVSARPVT